MNPLQTVLHEIETALSMVEPAAITSFATELNREQGRVFVVGEGRSGFMAKAFAMRLMHIGVGVYVIGETITPAIAREDTLIAISGSGTTAGVVDKGAKAHSLGCHVMGVTTNPDSPLAGVCSTVLHIPAATKYRKAAETASIQPLSSLFDQTTHIVLDVVCLELTRLRDQTNDSAMGRHSNLE